MTTIGILSCSSNTYAMPLQAAKLIPVPNMADIWSIDVPKCDFGMALSASQVVIPTPKPKQLSEIVVNKSKDYLGVPYVWGGTSPSGFDCSGLVQYVYQQIGIDLSRTTYTQVNEDIAISIEKLKQGDLVFFKKNGDVHHVGIYIGDGKYIHAPQTGDVVKISKLSDRNDFYTARRIIND